MTTTMTMKGKRQRNQAEREKAGRGLLDGESKLVNSNKTVQQQTESKVVRDEGHFTRYRHDTKNTIVQHWMRNGQLQKIQLLFLPTTTHIPSQFDEMGVQYTIRLNSEGKGMGAYSIEETRQAPWPFSALAVTLFTSAHYQLYTVYMCAIVVRLCLCVTIVDEKLVF